MLSEVSSCLFVGLFEFGACSDSTQGTWPDALTEVYGSTFLCAHDLLAAWGDHVLDLI